MGPVSRFCLLQVHWPGLPFPAALGIALPASSRASLSGIPLPFCLSHLGIPVSCQAGPLRGAVTGGILGGGSAWSKGGLPEPQVRGAEVSIFWSPMEDTKGRDQISVFSLKWSPESQVFLPSSVSQDWSPRAGPNSVFLPNWGWGQGPSALRPAQGPPTWESVGVQPTSPSLDSLGAPGLPGWSVSEPLND